jgi:hypothetical protein
MGNTLYIPGANATKGLDTWRQKVNLEAAERRKANC